MIHVSALYGNDDEDTISLGNCVLLTTTACFALPFLPPCLGLDEKGIRQILRASRRKAKLLKFNGMELAALRAEGSDELNLSG